MITEMKAGHLKDIDKPSEPFEVIGKIIPRYENENWTFTELLYEAPYLKSYQDEEDEEDEEADCLEYIDNTDKIIYHNCGFKIGSVDTMLYANFENNFEKAVFWYLRF